MRKIDDIKILSFHNFILLNDNKRMQESNTTLPMSPEDEMEAKIINRLQKTIVIKKIQSEKQKANLDRLAKNKAGSRYKKVEPLSKEDTEDIPVTVVDSCAKKVMKQAKKKFELPQPQSSSESSEEPVPKKAVRSKAVAKQAVSITEPEPPRSLFRKSLL